jgi:plasmid maintenance system antidote protein VapI
MEKNFELSKRIEMSFGNQRMFSHATKIPEAKISEIVRGHKQPTHEELVKMINALGCDPLDINFRLQEEDDAATDQ